MKAIVKAAVVVLLLAFLLGASQAPGNFWQLQYEQFYYEIHMPGYIIDNSGHC